MHNFETVLALLVGVTFLAMVARRLAVPTPAMLVVGGLIVALVPGLPTVAFDPQLVFLVFIPPLLFRTSLLASYRDFRANLRPIVSLGVGHVLFVTAAVAGVAHAALGLPWAAAVVLGAVVSPPDVAAATAFLRRLPMPRRIVTILEGESMVNDAAAIVVYRMAIAAVLTGVFSVMGATLRFLVIAAGGVCVGLVAGWVISMVRRRLHVPEIENTISLLSGYAAYLPAEHLGVSGVLAVVTTGLYLGRVAPRFVAADTRVQARGMWDVVVFTLEGLIFIITGLGLRSIGASLTGTVLHATLLVALTVIVARFVWAYPAAYLPRVLSRRIRKREPTPGWALPAVIAWAGLRGGDSLVLAVAIPTLTASGLPFPGRSEIIAITYGVIVITLLGLGFSLGPALRWLGVRETGAEDSREEHEARVQIAEAALARLHQLAGEPWVDPAIASRLRDRYRHRAERLKSRDPGADDARLSGTGRRLARELIVAERQALVRLRDDGAIGDGVMRRVERELDFAELLVDPA